MDLTQTKLTKSEWESIEIPIHEKEKKIVRVIMDGFNDVSIRYNENKSMYQFLNFMDIQDSLETYDFYFYNQFFEKEIGIYCSSESLKSAMKKEEFVDVASICSSVQSWKTNIFQQYQKKTTTKKMKKTNLMKINNMTKNIEVQRSIIFEYLLLEFCENILTCIIHSSCPNLAASSVSKRVKKSAAAAAAQPTHDLGFYLYTLIHVSSYKISKINRIVLNYVDFIISMAQTKINISEVFYSSKKFIEKNPYLLKYEDISLFAHQKELFTVFHSPSPKLVLYIAPTGTGKTLSPIGLASRYKIIFVCVARHVGLALAKSAISVGKKVAFAFGCETASDIRLHYFAAINYSVDKKSGGIRKVDNSIGNNVEIMICDLKSYIVSMHYMLAFNSQEEIITYWDEPTITMDYENHSLHELIHNNWVENVISKVVLSCATLPKESEIAETVVDFKSRFANSEVITVSSYDCKKSISILNKNCKCVLPHLLFDNYDELMECVKYCLENKTLLRYFDLEEILRFVRFLSSSENLLDESLFVENYFNSISEITLTSIKMYYLEIMKNIGGGGGGGGGEEKSNNVLLKWKCIQESLISSQREYFLHGGEAAACTENEMRKIKSVCETGSSSSSSPPTGGIFMTTSDAHTLTDGPTIFLVEDIEKVCKFYIQQTNIPSRIINGILEKIHENDILQEKISALEKSIEDTIGKDAEKQKKMEKESFNKETKIITNQIEILQGQIKTMTLDPKYIPNMKQHQMIWVKDEKFIDNAFIPSIDEETVKKIMLSSVSETLKILLLIGIGVFVNEPNPQYMEIIKDLAIQQKLYIIIAQSDYIYGTNYQFCHAYIGKDLENLTQQKIIQALGRVGRQNIQQEYTVRFRDDNIILKLFKKMGENREAINMCKLFNRE